MRFLANENFPRKSIHLLRSAGHDIQAIAEKTPGMRDEEVLAYAKSERRIIITFDRDYGELIYRRKLPSPAGVIFLRFAPVTPEEAAEFIFTLLKMDGLTLEDKFTIVSRDKVRQRLLPK